MNLHRSKGALAASGRSAELTRLVTSLVAPSQNALRRQLSVLSMTALVVGEVIAIGIFLTPAGMARTLGSPFWLLIVWLLMGLMALSGALCYGELAARYPEAGGGY